MSNSTDIKRLYYTVLFNDIHSHSVQDDDIKVAILNMNEIYSPYPKSLYSANRRLADYNSIAHRCAYLHKYAPFHTALVSYIFRGILYNNQDLFWTFQQLIATASNFKICSLGGGPGSDIVGVVAALTDIFGVFPCSAKVVDVKSDWRDTLRSVIHEMRSGGYGILGHCFNQRNFDWGYLTADLLDEVKGHVKAAIGKADLVTMVKFVSAAACLSTEAMLMKIFTMLKTGSMVLFIDNSGGGFRELVSKAAGKCKLIYVYGPIDCENYTNAEFNVRHWDYTSCFSTTVTIHMLRKLSADNHEVKNIFPNKRIKSAVYESSNQLQVQNLNQASSLEEPEICCQGCDEELDPIQAECLVEKISTPSIAQAGLESKHISNNNFFNSPLKANNEEMIITNKSRSATGNLSVKHSLNVNSKDSASVIVDSVSKVKDEISKTYNYNKSGIVVNSQPTAVNRDPTVHDYGTIVDSQPNTVNRNPNADNYGVNVNSLPKKDERVNSFGNDLPTDTRLSNESAKFSATCNESGVNNLEIYKGLEILDNQNGYLRTNRPICTASTNSLRQNSLKTPNHQKTSVKLCCSSCVIS